MRWEELFADLEGQLAAVDAAELAGEVADRTRREWAALTLRDRVPRGGQLRVLLLGGGHVEGTVLDVGVDWLLLEEAGRRELLVSTAGVVSIAGTGSRSEVADSEVERRLDLRWALRGIARNRSEVQLLLRDGSARSGTIDRVGADHLELAEHLPGEERRTGALLGISLVPLSALAAVRGT